MAGRDSVPERNPVSVLEGVLPAWIVRPPVRRRRRARDVQLVAAEGQAAQVDHRQQRRSVRAGIAADIVTESRQWLAVQADAMQGLQAIERGLRGRVVAQRRRLAAAMTQCGLIACGLVLCVFAQANPAPLEPVRVAPAHARSWARLIARIYEVDPLRCRRCGGTMRLIAFIVESAVIVGVLDHLGEPSRALHMAPIRGPPRADDYWGAIVDSDNDTPDPASQVMPDYESQRQDLSW